MLAPKRGKKRTARRNPKKQNSNSGPDFSKLQEQLAAQLRSRPMERQAGYPQPGYRQSAQFSYLGAHAIEPDQQNSSTGIADLDSLMEGGFPRGSVVLVAGSSGSGKTILALQWLFEGIKNNENGIYITLTEPLFKIVKNLEKLSFYQRSALEQEKLKIIDLRSSGIFDKADEQKVLDYIEAEVKRASAKRLCIDSITAIALNLDNTSKIRKFIFELGKILATLGCTTVLTSEVGEKSKFSVYGVEEFISDAIIRLDQIKIGDELQRQLQLVKIRGRSFMSQDTYFKITNDGIVVFPKFKIPLEYPSTSEKVSTGNSVLDGMMNGGVFKGSPTLVVGPSGSGKSLSCMHFIMEGLAHGEVCLYAGFEESRLHLIRNAKFFGWDFEEYEKKGLLIFRCVYPGQKFIEEHLMDIQKIIEKHKVQRCAIDSLSAISNSFPEQLFFSFSKRLIAVLKLNSVTTLLTTATGSLVGATRLTGSHLSVITDNIIMFRYVEMQGELRKVMNLIKVDGSAHSKGLRIYDVTAKGLLIGQPLSGYEGIITGSMRKVSETVEDMLRLEFKRFIGPMADAMFTQIKDVELTRDNITGLIDKLQQDGILKPEDSKSFKERVLTILTRKSDMDSLDTESIEQAENTEPEISDSGRKGFMDKLKELW